MKHDDHYGVTDLGSVTTNDLHASGTEPLVQLVIDALAELDARPLGPVHSRNLLRAVTPMLPRLGQYGA